MQKQNKSDHERKGRFQPTYVPDYYMFVDRMPLTTSVAEHPSADGYSKRMGKRYDPYRVPGVGPQYSKVLYNGVGYSDIIDHVTRVVQKRKYMD